jgi:hypothetical protein
MKYFISVATSISLMFATPTWAAGNSRTLNVDGKVVAATVPIEFIQGLPFVNVKVGAASLRMMFDSGGKLGLSLPAAAVDAAGTVKLLERKYRFSDLNGKVYEVPELQAEGVAVGTAQLGHVAGRVHTMWGGGATEGPEAELTHARESGAIGLDAFAGRPLMFDYGQQTLTIFEPGRSPKLNRSLRLQYGREGPIVILRAGGKSLRFAVDTGTPVNLVSRKALGCGVKCANRQSLDLSDGSGTPLSVQDAETADLNGAPFDGILGAPFFRSYRVVFDVKAGRLYIAPSKPELN